MLADVLSAMEEFPPSEARVTPRPQPPKPEPPPHPTGVADPDGDIEGDAPAPEPEHAALSTDAHLFGTHIDEESAPSSRKWWWIGSSVSVLLVALIYVLVMMLDLPEASKDDVIVSVETLKVEASAEPPPPVVQPVEVKVETPVAPIVPVVVSTVDPKLEAKVDAKAEAKPKAQAKPRAEPVKPKIEDPKPELATSVKVTMVTSVATAKLGDTITAEATVVLPEGETIASSTLRWRGEGGTWQPKAVTVAGGKTTGTIVVNAAMGAKVEYYIDVRTTSAPGKANKSAPVTVTVTQ